MAVDQSDTESIEPRVNREAFPNCAQTLQEHSNDLILLSHPWAVNPERPDRNGHLTPPSSITPPSGCLCGVSVQ